MVRKNNSAVAPPVDVDEPVELEDQPLVEPPPPTPRIRTTRPAVGIKTTERHTVERFSEPVIPVADDAADDEEEESAEAYRELLAGGPQEAPETPALSPIDQLLQTLKDSAECVIYVQRRQDPPGFEFRTPAPQNVSMGPLAWDASFNCKEAIDSAIQYAFGGGKYQLQLRVDNANVKQWTTIVADPPLRGGRTGLDQPNYPLPVAHKSVKEELREVAELWKMLGLTKQVDAPPPVDPISQVRDIFSSFASMQEMMKSMVPEPAPVVTGKNWFESAMGLGMAFVGSQQGQNLLGALTARLLAPPAAPAPLAQPAPVMPPPVMMPAPVDPQIEMVKLTQKFLDKTIYGLKTNQHFGEAFNAAMALFRAFPQQQAAIMASMAKEPVEILRELSVIAQEDLTAYDGASDWIADLRAEFMDSVAVGQITAVTDETADGQGYEDSHHTVEPASPEPRFDMDPEAVLAASHETAPEAPGGETIPPVSTEFDGGLAGVGL